MAVVGCEYCGEPANTKAKNVARQVTGWIVPRSGGGANHIKYPAPTGLYVHTACLEEYHRPAEANQSQLF